jgi:hypothetical protein
LNSFFCVQIYSSTVIESGRKSVVGRYSMHLCLWEGKGERTGGWQE